MLTFDEAQKAGGSGKEKMGWCQYGWIFDDTEDHYHDMEALLSVTFDEEADTEATSADI